jgi:hypothetical protein
VVLSALEQGIKSKIEKIGTPLRDWEIQINYGIKTGFNGPLDKGGCFIITQNKRDELIEKCPKAVDIIRPILRGRDIQKYRAEWSQLYVIGTFPSLKLNIENFPAVKNHLLSFGKSRLEQSGKPGARKETHNRWFETQDSISYWDDFFRPKIVWGEISDRSKFAYDESDFFVEATSFLMTGEKLKYLLGMLNSKLLEWHFNQIGTATGVGTNRWKKYTIELLPIKKPSTTEQESFEKLIDLVLKSSNDVSADLLNKIDQFVYRLYDLNEEEVAYISNVDISK